MGLLDSLFQPSTYGGQGGGLLGLLQQYGQMPGMNIGQANAAPTSDMLSASPNQRVANGFNGLPIQATSATLATTPDSYMPVGNYQMPVFGRSDPAQLPANSTLTQGMLPQQQTPPQMPQDNGPGFGDRLLAGLGGFANAGGPLQAISNLATGLATGQRMDPQGIQQQQMKATFDALVEAKVPRGVAMAAAMNPELLKQIAPAYLDGAPKLQETGTDPMTGQKTFGVWEPGDRKLTPIGGGNGATPTADNSGLGAFSDAVKNGVKGEDLYQYLPQAMAATVKGMIDGRQPPPSTVAMRNPATLALINAANAIDPNFDANSWKTRSTFNTQLGSSQPNSVGGQKTLMGTALGHLSELADSAAGLHNVDTPVAALGQTFNAVKNMGTDNAAKVNALNEKAARFSGEVGKLYSGSSGGGVHERESTAARFGGNKTSAELAAGLEASRDLIKSKLDALEKQAGDVYGPNKQIDFLGDNGRAALAKIDQRIAELRGQGGSSASQASPQYTEGMTATNPQTGQKLTFRNGKWQ